MQTKDVVTILHGENDIILNCTYKKDSKEDISNRKIRWQKLIDGKYENIAMFSPPSGQEPFIVRDMQLLYNNRTDLIAPNTSLSAVMIIKDPVCSDEGRYRCWIEYYSDKSEKFQTSGSIVEFHGIYYLLFIFIFCKICLTVCVNGFSIMFIRYLNRACLSYIRSFYCHLKQ